MGRYRIKLDMQLCQGHGECAEEAPEVFSVDYERGGYPKVRVSQATPDERFRAQVEAAAKYCPNRVIQVIDLDLDDEQQQCTEQVDQSGAGLG